MVERVVGGGDAGAVVVVEEEFEDELAELFIREIVLALGEHGFEGVKVHAVEAGAVSRAYSFETENQGLGD